MCGLSLSGLLLSGCQLFHSRGEKWSDVTGMTNIPPAEAVQYNPLDYIQRGESLIISITDTPMAVPLIMDQVKQDGTIKVLLDKSFMAAGKTLGDLEREIHDYYVPSIYKQMTVAVKHEPQTRFYSVGGEVRSPSRQVYISAMTVLKAIQSCGDFTDFANKRRVRLIHANGKTQIVNCKKMIDNPNLDVPVYPGDTIHVPRRLFW